MIRNVFYTYLSVLVITVATNPVPQVTGGQSSSTYQQNSYKNPSSASNVYQQPTSQTQSYSQPTGVQQQNTNRGGFESTINQQLINRIFENPCLQRILDPNTKLYNQNGQEIQRHPNSGTAPNVINNYFIVPPEFFNLNNITAQDQPQRTVKKKKNNNNKKNNLHKTKTNVNIVDDNNDSITVIEKQPNKRTNARRSNNKHRKQKKDQASVEIVEAEFDANNAAEGLSDLEKDDPKKVKGRRKQSSTNKIIEETLLPSETEVNVLAEEIIPRKSRKKSKTIREESSKSSTDIVDTILLDKVINTTFEPLGVEKVKQNLESKNVIKNKSELKNIESPVETREETKEPENRKIRNSKNNKVWKENNPPHNFSPFPDDIYRNLFPYMYMGNYLYPHGNYPFSLDQIYDPYFGRNNDKNKKRKNRKKQKEQNNKDSLPNVIEVPVKIKSKKKEIITTANPLSVEVVEKTEAPLDFSNLETIQGIEPLSDVSTEIPYDVTNVYSSENEFETEIPKKDSVVTKANIEMPPTMIEDLQDFIIPELKREDIVPTIYTNGVIKDYYPIFNDDSYYNNDESYYLRDLEDDRHFYNTDRGHEELLNRDRRKYDKNEDYHAPNFDIRDRINFRRGYKYREPDRLKSTYDDTDNSIPRPYTHEKIIERKETLPPELKYDEIRFHTPPKLENPDFKTIKVEVKSSKTDINTDTVRDPVYTGFTADNTHDNTKMYVDTLNPELNRMINADSDIRKEIVPSKTVRPKNDHIETVFAKTRVVKYGVAEDEPEEDIPISVPIYEDENKSKFYSDGHTTFVVAKSLGHVEDYYW